MPVQKVVDAWKSKKWFTVIAPNFLNNIEAADVPTQDEKYLVNRVLEIPLKEITRDIAHMYTSIKLRVHEIKGRKAFSKFIGHTIAREYLRTLVRRRRDVIETVFDAASKEGIEFRIKTMLVTEHACSGKQKHVLQARLVKELRAAAKAKEFGDFVHEVLFGKLAQELQKTLSKIVPVRRVEIWKTELKEEFDIEQPEGREAKEEKAEETKEVIEAAAGAA